MEIQKRELEAKMRMLEEAKKEEIKRLTKTINAVNATMSKQQVETLQALEAERSNFQDTLEVC